MSAVCEVSRPPMRIYGGKWRIAKWIISHFPPHVCYVEPFGGGASVLLRKPPSPVEVYNDLDRSLVNFFRVLRDRPEELIHKIEWTPWSRAELEAAREDCEEAVEWARRRYVIAMQSRSASGAGQSGGWRYQRAAEGCYTIPRWNDLDHLWAAARRLKLVQLECDDALAVIERYDSAETLFYVDPPYPAQVRTRAWADRAYAEEMDEEGHRELADVLRGIRGMAVVSGYPCALYEELYGDWACVETKAVDGAGRVRRECLWLSPRAVAMTRQGRLF